MYLLGKPPVKLLWINFPSDAETDGELLPDRLTMNFPHNACQVQSSAEMTGVPVWGGVVSCHLGLSFILLFLAFPVGDLVRETEGFW